METCDNCQKSRSLSDILRVEVKGFSAFRIADVRINIEFAEMRNPTGTRYRARLCNSCLKYVLGLAVAELLASPREMS